MRRGGNNVFRSELGDSSVLDSTTLADPMRKMVKSDVVSGEGSGLVLGGKGNLFLYDRYCRAVSDMLSNPDYPIRSSSNLWSCGQGNYDV